MKPTSSLTHMKHKALLTNFKADVRKTHDESKQEFNRARQWLSEKIAP